MSLLKPATSKLRVERYAVRAPGGQIVGRDSVLWRIDWLLFGSALALCCFGAVMVWSATKHRPELTGGDPQFFLKRHLLNVAIGMVLGAATMLVGKRWLRVSMPFVYGVAVLMLLAVFPLGTTINGAHSWIVIASGFSLQPSELAKIAIILAMATVLTTQVDTGELDHPKGKPVVQALVLAAVPMVIILVMPDLGSTMVVAVTVLGVLLVSGVANRWVFGLMAAGAVVAVAVWQLHILSTYQVDRFTAFANPNLDPKGFGYNTHEARIAIGSGGLLGQGLFHGAQTSGGFVPEQQTDFVFTVAGEELGFVGSIAIIILFAVLLWRGCRIARQSQDLFGTVVAGGVVTWLAFQTFENIGMNLGIMPVTGVPIPFVSYGGSSMFAVWIAIGLLQAVRLQRPVPLA